VRLERLLAWMAEQEFPALVDSGLLREVEEIVVEGHRTVHERGGRPWSRPDAYRWLRYEDPVPVRRLIEGVERLRREAVEFDADAVDKACVRASEMGFLN